IQHAQELNRYADAIFNSSNSAIEYESNTEFTSGDNWIRVSAVAQHAIGRTDRESPHCTEPGDQGVGQPGTQIVRSGIGAELKIEHFQRQYSQRILSRDRLRLPHWPTERRIGPDGNRRPGDVARDVVSQLFGGLVAPFRLLAQRPHNDAVERARQIPTQRFTRSASG